MKSKKGFTKTVYEYESKYSPEQIWEFFVHPKYTVEFTRKPCYYYEISNDFSLTKGQKWKEIHTGEDCKGGYSYL